MKGLLSFHPVDLKLYDVMLSPLIAGEKVNPEPFLDDAVRMRSNACRADRIPAAIREILQNAGPPSTDPDASLWRNLRTRLEKIDYRPDPVTRRVLETVDPDLHLEGRPFFVVEGSAEKVADVVEEYRTCPTSARADALALEQLVKLDKDLARELRPVEGPSLSADFTFRREMLAELKSLFDLPNAARNDLDWRERDGRPVNASRLLPAELPWRTHAVHARVIPFWTARDVDGLETICAAAGVEPPSVLVPPWRMFGKAMDEFPDLRESLRLELSGDRAIGGFVPPDDVPQALDFLLARGSAIIRVAARHGEGPACTVLLKKIRECLTYAGRHGMGYLEASGILPPHHEYD